MSAFTITDKDGIGLSVNTLDKEAAAFWNKEIDSKWYADPSRPFVNTENLSGIELFKTKMKYYSSKMSSNWFDIIGYNIAKGLVANPKDISWENVISAIMSESLTEHMLLDESHDKVVQYMSMIKEIYQPYIDLIKHWKIKGYIPIRIDC